MALSSDPASGIVPSGSQVLRSIISSLDRDDSTGGEECDMVHSQEPKLPDNSSVIAELATAAELHKSDDVLDSLPEAMLKSQVSLEERGTDIIVSSIPENLGSSFSSTPGYLANRWNLANSSFSTPSTSQIATVATPPM